MTCLYFKELPPFWKEQLASGSSHCDAMKCDDVNVVGHTTAEPFSWMAILAKISRPVLRASSWSLAHYVFTLLLLTCSLAFCMP